MPRLRVVVYGLLFCGEVVWSAVFPLAPVYRDKYGLTATEVGVLLGAATIAILLVSVPAGLLADRTSTRWLAVGSSALLAVSAAGNGVADTFSELLAARVAFGIAFGTMWTAALALLAAAQTPAQQERSLSASVVIAGLGTTVGPSFGGIATQQFGIAVPFLTLAGLVVVLTVALIPASRGVPRTDPVHQRLVSAARRLGRQPLARSGLWFMALAGFVAATINLLVPLRLAAGGVSTSVIGGVFSAGAVVFFTASLVITRAGQRAAQVAVGAVASLALAALLVVPLVVSTVPALVVFAVLRAPLIATLFTVSMPLAARGADRVGVNRGVLLGLANAVWAVSGTTGPIIAGALDDHVSQQASWLLDITLCGASGAWLLVSTRRWRSADAAVDATRPS
jgi:MFS family permease